ncbi:MAG TPA: 50S ribosomal protein L18 [Candidatus Paceibacterota bacterium]|nr:50S ribosomal protein L18 [Candidatus Paceibacterota bacterium]
MNRAIQKRISRERRHARIRARVIGSPERPRLTVYKSNRFMHAQIIDDAAGKTLLSGTTKGIKAKKMEAAKKLGIDIAKRAKEMGISAVVFDRSGFRYTGRVATLATAVREGGLKM